MLFLASVPFWLLLTQGTGASSSVIHTVKTYRTEVACQRDAALMKKAFYVSTLCMLGNSED